MFFYLVTIVLFKLSALVVLVKPELDSSMSVISAAAKASRSLLNLPSVSRTCLRLFLGMGWISWLVHWMSPLLAGQSALITLMPLAVMNPY